MATTTTTTTTTTMAEGPNTSVIDAPYPAQTCTINVPVGGIDTTVTRICFSDKIIVTATQAGRLNHWVHVVLSNANPAMSFMQMRPAFHEDETRPDSALLPLAHLTATTVLGGTRPEMEVVGQTLATNVASAILARQKEEDRLLVMGLGLDPEIAQRGGIEDLVAACIDVL